MKLYVMDELKLTKFDLPQEIQESFLFQYVSDYKEYPISIEALDNKWQIKSNGKINVIINNAIVMDTFISEYNVYDLEIASTKKMLKLYCLPSVDENLINMSLFDINEIKIGNNPTCNIFCNNPLMNGVFSIVKNENNYLLNAQDANVYVNGVKQTQTFIKMGDIIFFNGLRMIFMYNYIRCNNPNNSIIFNNIQSYGELNTLNNTSYEIEEDDVEIELYSDNEYFYHTPRIRDYVQKSFVTIDPPSGKETLDDMPVILALGSSFTLAASTMLNVYTTIHSVNSGQSTWENAWPSLVLSGIMLVSSVVLPIVTKKWQDNRKIKLESLRQSKYGEYLTNKEKEIKNILVSQEQILNNLYPTYEECYNIILNKSNKLWYRKIEDKDFLEIRLGKGVLDANIEIKYPPESFRLEEDNLIERAITIGKSSNVLTGVPIVSNLLNEKITAIITDEFYKSSYINNVILQILSLHSAMDLKIVCFSKGDELDYLKYSPHIWSEDKTTRFFAKTLVEMKNIATYLEKDLKNRKEIISDRIRESKEEGSNVSFEEDVMYQNFSSYYLIITDCYDKIKNLSIINDICQKQEFNYGHSILILDTSMKNVPIECTNFIYINKNETYAVETKEDNNVIKKFDLELKYNYDMNYISSILANIPISAIKGSSELPKSLSFLEMYNVSKIEQLNILNRWKENDPTVSLKVPIGVHADRDLFLIDLHEKVHGPHGLIAGSTGSGKSEFIITFVLSMAINYHPYEVAFVLIDYKGGGLAGAFENREKGISIPHLAGTITNLDTSEMNRTLVSINSELKRRQAEFNKARDALGEGTIDIYKYQRFYREGKIKDPIPHLFIISDEFAELKSQQPDFMDELVSTARIGRSLGVHLILATQKPSGVVDDQIWSNSKFKICLKVSEREDSMEMLKKPDAASIKETGRFYLQVGYDEYFAMGQSGWAGAKYLPSDKIIKTVDDSVDFIDSLANVYKKVNNEIDTKKDVKQDLGEQLPNIVKYMVDLAKMQNIKTKMLWLSSIPEKIYIEGLKNKYDYKAAPYHINPVIGEYDNPARQIQGILTLDLTNVGNTAIYGMPGAGKENLLTTMIYDICNEHSPEEVNIYVLDFGAETLKMFAKYPHVGGVATIDDADMYNNLFQMMYEEVAKRKELFADYAGSYTKYIKESGKKLPLIVIVINGYDMLSENMPRLEDYIFNLIKDGPKYGIAFVCTTSINNGINYRIAQMFMNTISLQQKQDDVYSDIVSSPRGLTPKRIFGRGLVAKEKTAYEFQTAYFCSPEEIGQTIRDTCKVLTDKYKVSAKKIKTLPKYVTVDMMKEETTGLDHVALGINKATLNPLFYNLDNLPCTTILTNRIFDNMSFVIAFTQVIASIKNVEVSVVDCTGLFTENLTNVNYYNDNFDIVLRNIINEVNKEGKDSTKRVFVFLGIGVLKTFLSEVGEKLYDLLFTNANRFKNSKFIFIDDYKPFQELEMESWYSLLVNDISGIWLGPDGYSQNAINLSAMTSEQRDDESEYLAFVPGSKGVVSFKYVVRNDEGEQKDE